MRVFTKRFFGLSPLDQVQVVNAALRDLEECAGRSIDKAGRERAKRTIRRIRRKAVDFGVFSEPDQEQKNCPVPHVEEEAVPHFKITVGQLIAALADFGSDMPVEFNTDDALGYGLKEIGTDHGVCVLHSSAHSGPIVVAELLGRLEDVFPKDLGVVLRAEGVEEARAVTVPFEDECGDKMCVCVTTF